MNIKLDIGFEEVKLILSLLKHSDPLNFYVINLRNGIEKQVVAQIEEANKAKLNNFSNQNGSYDPNNIEIRQKGKV